MADLFDQAQDTAMQDAERARKIQQLKAASSARLQPQGECLNPLCGEPLKMVLDRDKKLVMPLFCGPACAREHAKRVK